MMKHITSRVAAAALAASVALTVALPAVAQPGNSYGRDNGQLDGGPALFSGQEDFRRGDRDDRGRDDWRRRKPDFQTMQRDCSKQGIETAWNRNYYSAQYHDSPRLVEGRYGWELRGKMRLHDRKGYSYIDTICDYDRGRVDFEFRR